ncbi:MAG: inositol monophosphatase, partial [Gammaproteobacteria bacterium]|nr:inositol monophosphatase [Gammaproteobacteria bacterium]
SAALDLAYVATGRFDGFWEMDLREWDLAAGCLLVEEAGGLVGDLNGGQEHLASGHILAANAALFGDMLEIIRARIESQARHTRGET